MNIRIENDNVQQEASAKKLLGPKTDGELMKERLTHSNKEGKLI